MSKKTRRLGRYRLGCVLRKVGPIVFFEAYHEDLVVRRRIAAIPREYGEPSSAAIYVDSPYVVKVYEVGVEKEWSYAVTEWAPWPPLSSLLEYRKLSASEAATLLHDVLHALADLEKVGLEHHYLVPDLILVGPSGFLLDGVGLAHLLDGPRGSQALAEMISHAASEIPQWLHETLHLARKEKTREALASLREGLKKSALKRLARLIVAMADLNGTANLRKKALALLARGSVNLTEVERLERELRKILRSQVK